MDTKEIKVNNLHMMDNPHYYAENLDFVNLLLDNENKIILGIQTDGTFYVSSSQTIDGSLNVNGNINTYSVDIENIDNPEYLSLITDNQRKFIAGIKKDGTVYIPNLNTDSVTKNLLYEKWHNKKIICFGDSITEYAEYVTALEDFFDTPIYNRGNSGRSVALGGQTHSFVERVTYPANNDLISHNGGLPSQADLIFLEGGVNDWALLKEQELGDIKNPITTDISAPRENNTLYTFAGAYMFVLAKLKEKYPNAEIYTLNIHGIQSNTNDRWKEVFFTDSANEYSGFVYNNNKNIPGHSYTIEKTLEDYRKIIREASSFYGVQSIELKNSKINFLCKENRALLSKDGLHPNDEGGYEMAKFIINNLNVF